MKKITIQWSKLQIISMDFILQKLKDQFNLGLTQLN